MFLFLAFSWSKTVIPLVPLSVCQVKSSHVYLYSAFHNTDCIKAASQ